MESLENSFEIRWNIIFSFKVYNRFQLDFNIYFKMDFKIGYWLAKPSVIFVEKRWKTLAKCVEFTVETCWNTLKKLKKLKYSDPTRLGPETFNIFNIFQHSFNVFWHYAVFNPEKDVEITAFISTNLISISTSNASKFNINE